MAVPDAFRAQTNVWLMFLVGMQPSFVLRSVSKLTPNYGQAQPGRRTLPHLRSSSERGGALAPPLHPSPKLMVSFGGLPIRNHAVDQVDLKQPVEPIELASPARNTRRYLNTFGYSSEFLSSLHLNILPHLSTSDCIVPAQRKYRESVSIDRTSGRRPLLLRGIRCRHHFSVSNRMWVR